jgi:tetratricopeptide (TPR) repeat protein
MRSEFLGACSLIEDLAEAINEGAYLTPRMTRSECRQAIEGPAAICGIEIEEPLVNWLLNDLARFASWSNERRDEPEGAGEDQLSRLARRADQLPLLQHALNRMWEEARAAAQQLEPGANGIPTIKLTLAHYESIGGLQGALDKHAGKVLGGLKQALGEEFAVATTKRVFQAVTTGTTAADAVRRPTRVAELVKLCAGNSSAVHEVIDAFRAEGCNFLQPEIDPTKPVLENREFVDVTHESLIRQWTQLREWAREEFEAAEAYRSLEDTAKRWKEGHADLLSARALAAWREREPVNEAWAARYGKAFGEAMEFMRESQEDLNRRQEAERLAAERKLQQEKQQAARFEREKAAKRLRMVIASAIAVAVISGGIYLVLAIWKQAEFATRNFQLAVSSAQNLLNQVGNSLNSGDITVNGANEMLKVASGIVEQVRNIKRTPETIPLLVKLALTAHDINATLGNLPEAYVNAESAKELLKPLSDANPNDPEILTSLYNSLWRMGDATADRDVNDQAAQERALSLFQQAEKIASRLLEMAPDDADRQWNVAFVLEKIGDVKQVLKDWPRAIAEYQAALTTMKCEPREPSYPRQERECANILSKLGQALAGKGDREAALKKYREALIIREQLAQSHPMDESLRSNVAGSRRDIARLLARHREFDAALQEYRIAIGIWEDLLTKDTANANWLISLAAVYAGAGDALAQKSDWAAALEQYRKAYAARRSLVLKDKSVTTRQYALAVAGIAVADALVRRQQDLDEAVSLYRAAITSLDDLKPRYDPDVFNCYMKIGSVAESRKDPQGALTEYETALGIARHAATKSRQRLCQNRRLTNCSGTHDRSACTL